MLSIFIKRVLMAIPVLLAVASLTFFLVKLAPGGPFDADKAVSPQVLKNLNEAYNLNATEWEQYVDSCHHLILLFYLTVPLSKFDRTFQQL